MFEIFTNAIELMENRELTEQYMTQQVRKKKYKILF